MNLTYGLLGLVKEVVSPVARRLGTMLAVALVTEGVVSEQADLLVSAIGAVAAISFDVGAVLLRKKMWGGR